MHSTANGDDWEVDVLYEIKPQSETPKIDFIDESSHLIFEQKEHALIVISPFNSYYSEERIEKIIHWTLNQNFKKIHIFTGAGLWFYNFLALGYTEKEALQKTHKEDSFLHRRIKRVLERFGITENIILQANYFDFSFLYQKYITDYREQLLNDSFFTEILYGMVSKMNVQKMRNRSFTDIYLTYEYFIRELPLFLESPSLFNVQSSIFIYYQSNPLAHYLYNQMEKRSKNQGFGVLNFSSEKK